jgi:DNA-directed RNA polymerase specialized sigma24 family protein
MSKSAPDQLEASDGHLRTVEAFRQETPRLRAWLRRNAAAWQNVDDLLQDLFLELVLANRAARRIEDTGAWLFRVARNRITDALRQRQPLNRAVSILSLPDPIASGMDQSIAASEAAGPETAHDTALARKRHAVLHLRKKLAPFQERYFTD